MPSSGHIFCLFSNLWFYIGTGDPGYDTETITKIKQVHGMTRCINLDTKLGFWSESMAKYQQYDPAIVAQLQLRNSKRLADTYKSLCNMITAIITKPTGLTKTGSVTDHMILLYTINPLNAECLIALYLYYLCKTSKIDIKTATEILKTKIQMHAPGSKRAIVQFTDDMKKFLYLHCNTNAHNGISAV